MFMNNVHKKEEIRKVAIEDLRNFGLKYRPKKSKQHTQELRNGKRIFKRPLHLLPTETVTLLSGQQLVVPRIVHQLCTFILRKAETEGLFRKGGSKSRQNEIKLLLDAGCSVTDDHHEIDVANVLKTFLRELPEPLIPYSFHDLFLRCTLLGDRKTEAILLACLLLPTEHLNTLAYLMQFFYSITEQSFANKMDAYNIAVVIGPSVFPAEEKIVPDAQQRLLRTCDLFKVLVESANNIGILPESILERIVSSNSSVSVSDDESAPRKKKKRRSGSLTRMLNGIKKIVGSKANEDSTTAVVTPDLLLTPRIRKSVKKRRIESNNISTRKKREILNTLPDGALRTPIIPARTPVSANPNPKRKSPLASCKPTGREKKKQWYSRAKGSKGNKVEGDLAAVNSEISQSTKSLFERRWSAVSQASVFRRAKKRNSCHIEQPISVSEAIVTDQVLTAESDYVKIPKTEYEEIKNRVSAIERRISVELQNAGVEEDSDNSIDHSAKNVQYVYEKTLVEAEPLSPTTDHLARRLSKELKIRRSCDQKVYRSPSARKIGTLRRRSRELEKQNVKLARNKTWHIHSDEKTMTDSPKSSLMFSSPALKTATRPNINSERSTVQNRPTRAASFHSSPIKLNATISSNGSWVTAEEFFSHSGDSEFSLENSRTSLAKLRNQNAGMVMERAKLFDGLSDAKELKKSKACNNRKIGMQRSQVSRPLRTEDKLTGKKSVSPMKRKSRSPNIIKQRPKESGYEKENIAAKTDDVRNMEKVSFGVLKQCNRVETLSGNANATHARTTPLIKKSLKVRSPRRLCRTPKITTDRIRTPLRAEPLYKNDS